MDMGIQEIKIYSQSGPVVEGADNCVVAVTRGASSFHPMNTFNKFDFVSRTKFGSVFGEWPWTTKYTYIYQLTRQIVGCTLDYAFSIWIPLDHTVRWQFRNCAHNAFFLILIIWSWSFWFWLERDVGSVWGRRVFYFSVSWPLWLIFFSVLVWLSVSRGMCLYWSRPVCVLSIDCNVYSLWWCASFGNWFPSAPLFGF